MKTKIIYTLLALTTALNGVAQNNADTNKGKLSFYFLGSDGEPVMPDYIDFKKRGSLSMDTVIKKERVSKNGTISVTLPKGTYDVSVHKQGYQLGCTDFEVNEHSGGTFMTWGIVPLKRRTREEIMANLRVDAMLMKGHIVDDSTMEPLPNVRIYSKDKIAQATTDEMGNYKFYLPLPEDTAEIEDRGTIFFEKQGYITEVRARFDMGPNMGGPGAGRMKRGSGINTDDLFKKGEREPFRMTLKQIREDKNIQLH